VFQGFVNQGDAFPVVVLVTTSAGAPVNLDALPTYRVYGPDGLVAGQTGSATFRDSGAVTGATNASPIVATSVSHGLQTGDRVTVAGVLGNTAANGTFTITRLSADTFSLDGSTGNGAYTSGGAWNVTGLYVVSLSCTSGNGYEAGATYEVLLQGKVATISYAQLGSFGVT
jgi:hypothetical protein